MEETKHEYLQRVLETHKISHISDLIDKYKAKKDDVKTTIEGNYSISIYNPINSGSFAKHTAINCKFDLDVVVPFKRNSFATLENMFDDVFEYLKEEYKSEAFTRKQKVSIGIEFYPDDDGDSISLDIVPGRELKQDQYSDDKNLNLFVNSTYGLIEEKTHIQTNIQAQIDHIKAKENERKIIRLLKIWKISNNERYKSFFLELLVIKAFDKEDISGNLWEKLKGVMTYTKDNVTKDSFSLKDPGNSGNDVIDTLNSTERQNLSNTMNTIIENIEANKEYLKIYFPINEEFNDTDDKNGYGVKSISGASIPPDNTRFG
jgi:hypothetical protein